MPRDGSLAADLVQLRVMWVVEEAELSIAQLSPQQSAVTRRYGETVDLWCSMSLFLW